MMEVYDPPECVSIMVSKTYLSIKRMWDHVVHCVVPMFHYIFYAPENESSFTVNNLIDVMALHLLFLTKINQALKEI